jgi:hypothetical protein
MKVVFDKVLVTYVEGLLSPSQPKEMSIGELIYTSKMIQPGVFSRFSQPVHIFRFKPDNLLLSTARFSGYNHEKFTG